MSEEHTGPARGEDTARRLEADERYFRRQGLPTLIEDYSATEDILTRAWPWLAVLFLVQVMRSIATSWTPRMAGAILGGSVCAILAAWALVNRWKSRRLFAPPSRLGWWSAAVFVLVPSLMRMSGGDVMPALRHVAFNVAVCTLVVGVIGWGLAQTLAWALLRLIADLGRQLVIVFRQMAAIFLFCFLLFFTQEMWQFATVSDPVRFRTLAGVLAAFALLMVVAGTPRLTRQLEGDLLDESERLTWGQRTNLTLLFAVRQSLQLCVILLVAFAVFAVLSVAVVGQELYAAWDLPPRGRRLLPLRGPDLHPHVRGAAGQPRPQPRGRGELRRPVPDVGRGPGELPGGRRRGDPRRLRAPAQLPAGPATPIGRG